MEPPRRARISRETKETKIELALDLDGGDYAVSTDVKFLDHMLEAFAKHSGCGLTITARGDGMDHHHLIEDVAIALGTAIYQALGDKSGIARFVTFGVENLGDLKTELVSHFFHSLTENGRFNLHLVQMSGTNSHHLCEASFKAFARAFAQAKAPVADRRAVPSTKGMLA